MPAKGFNFVADGELAAVVANSDAAAQALGYKEVREVGVATLIVYHDGVEVFRDEVSEGKFRSAVFVEAWMAYRGHTWRQTDWVLFDTAAVLVLRGYMGEKVWAQASDPKSDSHGFLRAVLAGVGKEIRVGVEWKTIARPTAVRNI